MLVERISEYGRTTFTCAPQCSTISVSAASPAHASAVRPNMGLDRSPLTGVTRPLANAATTSPSSNPKLPSALRSDSAGQDPRTKHRTCSAGHCFATRASRNAPKKPVQPVRSASEAVASVTGRVGKRAAASAVVRTSPSTDSCRMVAMRARLAPAGEASSRVPAKAWVIAEGVRLWRMVGMDTLVAKIRRRDPASAAAESECPPHWKKSESCSRVLGSSPRAASIAERTTSQRSSKGACALVRNSEQKSRELWTAKGGGGGRPFRFTL
mmetsp:Transcript_44379/g.73980  ORF Transcript_44379/g.73980 Transcript_44379/m.73980 type:complete len:269 (-) Transcript_44379:2083-2889(-)